MSITTIDTKTGEIKQITQEELVEILKEASSLGFSHFLAYSSSTFRKTPSISKEQTEPMPISVDQIQQILESVPQGDNDDPRVIQGSWVKLNQHENRFNLSISVPLHYQPVKKGERVIILGGDFLDLSFILGVRSQDSSLNIIAM